ncbi:hypothetical protein GGE07_001381 [Sinorhizobium terangae]|nr:hypothetical protein [Sinorhizobium terangae]
MNELQQLGNVASAEAQSLTHDAQMLAFGGELGGGGFKFGRACDERREIEAKSFADGTAVASPGVALAVRAVAPKDQACFDERCEVAPQGRSGHAMRSKRKLGIGRKNDKAGVPGQFRAGIKAEQRVQHRQRAIGDGNHGFGFAEPAKQFPLVDRSLRPGAAGSDLACEHAKRHRPPPKGRRHTSTFHFSSPYPRQKKTVRRNDVKNS